MDDTDLELYRALSPGKRLRFALDLSQMAWHCLDVPNRDAGERKWATWNREHALSNDALVASLERIRSAERAQGIAP